MNLFGELKIYWIRKFYLTVCGLFFSMQCHAQLTGPFRDDFIKGAAESCYKMQRMSPDNNAVSDLSLKKYCTCSWDYLANLMTKDMLKKGQAPDPTWVQMAGQFCQKNFSKY
jgi:hypothetical protein